MKTIKLNSKLVAFVDDDDFDRLSAYNWRPLRYNSSNKFCAITWTKNEDGSYTTIYMHRFILNMSNEDPNVDHKNRNSLDNRKENLRIATPRQNNQNRGLRTDNTSGYKGVTFDTRARKWRARIQLPDGKRLNIGRFFSKIAAAKAYDKAATKYFGEFAALNFPFVEAKFWSMNLNLF